MSEQKPIEAFIPIYKFKVGYLWIPFRLPTQFLSDLVIDVDKDWAGYRIKNLGAPIDLYDALRLIDLINHKTSSPIDHPDGSITTAKIADGAITTAKIADGSITRAKLSGVFPITTSDISDGAITTAKIADGSVTRAKIESPLTLSNVILEVLTSDPPLAVGRIWYRSDLDRISYSPDGINIRRIPPSPIGSSDIADGAITTDKIADAAVTSAKIADGSITTSKIADASITPPKIKSVTTPSDGYVLSYDASSGLFKWTASAGGVTALSQLVIDVDKDWGGHVIKNLGAPVDPGDSLRLQDLTSHRTATPIDHPDGSITRAKLEPATASPASIIWSTVKGRIQWPIGTPSSDHRAVATLDAFADATLTCISADQMRNMVRMNFTNKTGYTHEMITGNSASDHLFVKWSSGTATQIGYEAVDLSNVIYTYRVSAVGSTFYCYRDNLATARFSVTDTTAASGCWGIGAANAAANFPTVLGPLFGSSYRVPPVVAYFEVPVVGSGTPDDPFRAQMPELIEWEWSINPLAKKKYDILKARGFTDEEILALFPELQCCRTNRLALTHSALIKADRATGKPVEYVAIVRIFDQPDRQPHLHPISRALDSLRSMKGARKLSREEAIRRAKQVDPDLTDVDLMPISPSRPDFKKIMRDYVEHRKGLGVREDMIDEKLMEQYLQEDKGW